MIATRAQSAESAAASRRHEVCEDMAFLLGEWLMDAGMGETLKSAA